MLNELSSNFNWEAWLGPFDPLLKLEVQQVKKKFNNTISQEEHKTIFSGLRISEKTLSNQSHFPQFFCLQKLIL
jgi:hypothetical protein